MKCKNCCYFSGVQCHGHGEYWGKCALLEFCYKEIVNKTHCDYVSTNFNDICYDDSDCIIQKHMNLVEKWYETKN